MRQEGHAQRQILRHQRVESIDAGARPGVTACRAHGVTPCKKKAELQTFLKLTATLWKQGHICGVCLGVCLPPPCLAQRTFVFTEGVTIPNSVKMR